MILMILTIIYLVLKNWSMWINMNSYSNPNTIYINNDLKTGWIYNLNYPYEWEFSSDIFLYNSKKYLTLLDYLNNHQNDRIWLDTIVLPNMKHVKLIDVDKDRDNVSDSDDGKDVYAPSYLSESEDSL